MRGEFIDLDGSRLYCYAAGTRGDGNPVVLVHGCFTSSYLWRAVLPRIPDGHRTLVVDLLGHGRSDPSSDKPMTVDAHADRLASMMNVFGIRNATLIGHGVGAAVVARTAAVHPRFAGQLVFIAPALLDASGNGRVLGLRMQFASLLVPIWKHLPPGWLGSVLYASLLPGFADNKDGARSLDVHLRAFRSNTGRDTACAQLRGLADSVSHIGCGNTNGKITQPVLVVHGGHDPFLGVMHFDRLTRELREVCTGGLIVQRIPEASHMVPEDSPEILSAILGEFLSGRLNSSSD